MKPELIIIDQPEQIVDLMLYLRDFDLIAYDCETTGLTKQDQIIGISVCAEESKAFYIILSEWSPNISKLTTWSTMVSTTRDLVDSLQGKQLIMHNSVFDCMMAEAFFKIDLMPSLHTDTMILAHLLDENRPVGLKSLAYTLFGAFSTQEQKEMKQSVVDNGGLLTKDKYEMYKADSRLLGKYGAQDALLTYKLFTHLVPELYEQGLDKFFYEEESMPLLKGPTYQLNTTGLHVDTTKLSTLKKTLEAECLEAKAFIYKEIADHIKVKYPGTNKKNTFNIGASQQLSWLLFGQLGLEFGTLSKGGKVTARAIMNKIPYTYAAKREFISICERDKGSVYQPEACVNGKLVKAKKLKDPWAYIAVDKKTLEKLAPKYKWIQVLLDYKRKLKLLNTYVEGIEERVKYGVIQPSFLQHGTTSGRYACRNPNWQNLPRDDKRIKQCVISRPDKILVGADYSQLEPRVFAYYSQDARLMEAFKGVDDFYSVIGMEVYNILDALPIKEGHPDAFGIKYKKLRDLSKVIALASTYGATAHQLAPTTGKSIEDTQQDIDNYFERFPGVAEMMLEAHKLAKSQGFVTNLFGRPRRMPEAKKINKIYGDLPHGEYPYEIRNLLNLAVNHRIQSTSASIVNRAMIKLFNNCKSANIDAKIVSQVHDSIIVECYAKDAENVALLMQDAMENTTKLKGVALEAIPKIGKNFSEV